MVKQHVQSNALRKMEMLLHVVLVFLVAEVWSQDGGQRVKSFRLGEDVNLTCVDTPHRHKYIFSIWTITRQGKNCSIGNNFTGDYKSNCMDHNKNLTIINHKPTLHIRNFSLSDVGIYNCDSPYEGGADHAIYTTTIIAPPEILSWVEWRGDRRVAVCRAEGASPAANVSWLITGNATTKTSESDGLITVETSVELPTPERAQNISCTVTHPYWDEPHVIRPDFSPRQAMSQNRTAVYVTIAISVVFCLAMLVLGIKKVTHFRVNTNSSKSPSVEEVEEVEPYESYIQRVNSIYNSSRDLFA